MTSLHDDPRRLARRRRDAGRFLAASRVLAGFASGVFVAFLVHLVRRGIGWLDPAFLTDLPSRFAESTGIGAALTGSVTSIAAAFLIATPVAVATAIYLGEVATPGRWHRATDRWLRTLAEIPPVLYGIAGLLLLTHDLDLGRSMAVGALTLAAILLPRLYVASRDALDGVPRSFRHAAWAIGAGRWQTVRRHVLPNAGRDLLGNVAAATGRTCGEAAPVLVIAGVAWVAFVPTAASDPLTTLPIEIFHLAARPEPSFHELASAGALVLLVLYLLCGLASLVRRERIP